MIAQRNELKNMGLYDKYKKDFINHALGKCIWNYQSMWGKQKEEMGKKLSGEWFEELEIINKEKSYFERANDYAEYIGITRQNEKDSYSCAISVIMPCHNSAEYLSQSLESIAAQSFKAYELICIDDCSDDATPDILRNYAEKDQRIRFFKDRRLKKPNGPGQSRNVALKKAKGKYIYYMDSDDLLQPECFEILYETLEKNKLDLLLFEAKALYDSHDLELKYPVYKTLYHRNNKYLNAVSGECLFSQLSVNKDFIVQPCMQIIRRDVIKNNNISFPKLVRHVDEVYSVKAILAAERAMCIPDPLFIRRVRWDSVTTKKRPLEDNIRANIGVLSELMNISLLRENKDYVLEALRWRLNIIKNRTAWLYKETNMDERKRILSLLNDKEKTLLAVCLTSE